MFSRTMIFFYGLASYLLTLGVFVYGMGFIAGIAVPTSLDAAPSKPLGTALAIDLGLLSVFAVQHSGMARPAFKRWWTRIVPEPAERATYVLLSSILMILLYACWQPIGGVVWSVDSEIGRDATLALYLSGWLLLVYTTFLIDHFDLFGLKQVWRQLRGKPYIPPQFHTPSLYRLVRHPLYIGWLTIFWAAPVMTAAHLVFAVVTTLYILVAIRFEERDLMDAFGDDYLRYRGQTGMLLPKLAASKAPEQLRAAED
ncbi:MAG TPA: isoprenylcysteine carboxylmethyltransferase family protein [Rhizomicrobium sp.]|nr:isoprenylcysteine carboxylmethyltransferase family protein [Rhizomicrobium sp.]